MIGRLMKVGITSAVVPQVLLCRTRMQSLISKCKCARFAIATVSVGHLPRTTHPRTPTPDNNNPELEQFSLPIHTHNRQARNMWYILDDIVIYLQTSKLRVDIFATTKSIK